MALAHETSSQVLPNVQASYSAYCSLVCVQTCYKLKKYLITGTTFPYSSAFCILSANQAKLR